MTRVKMREMEGKELPQGDAEDFIPNSSFGEGKVLILDYNGRRHLAYQIDHTEDGLTVFQGNKKPCKVDTELLTWKHLQTHLVGFYDVK